MKQMYYHLSFDDDLEGEWKPRTPVGFDMVKDAKGYGPNMTEPRTPRICLSPSLAGCFAAIYPNIYSLFEVKKYPHSLHYVYGAEIDDQDPLFNETSRLTKDRAVWDAHLTQEVWYRGKLNMRLLQRIKCTPNLKKSIYVHPFNDPDEARRYHSPEIEIQVVKRYPSFYKR